MTEIDVIVPAVNEEQTVGATLNSIASQQLPANIFLRVIVIPNGCTDGTAEAANTAISELGKLPNITFEVHELKRPGKNWALNHGLRRGKSPLVFCVDSDVRFSDTCFADVAASFDDPVVQVSGAEPHVVINEALAETLLGQIYRVRQIKRLVTGGRLMPMGRMIAFRRGAISGYREDYVGAEDTWLPLEVARKFGWKAVKVVPTAKVWAMPPQNWLDLIRQESRWELNVSRLIRHFPELRPVADELEGRRLVGRMLTTSRRREVLRRMMAEGIGEDVLELNERLMPELLRDNAALMGANLAKADGRWEGVRSTKIVA